MSSAATFSTCAPARRAVTPSLDPYRRPRPDIRLVGPCRDWCQVEYRGVSGWVNRNFLTVEAAVAPFTQRAPETSFWRVVGVASNDVLMVRTAPSQQAPVAHVYPPTAACVVGMGECQGPWCQVRIPAREGYQVGWVDAKQVAPSNAACN